MLRASKKPATVGIHDGIDRFGILYSTIIICANSAYLGSAYESILLVGDCRACLGSLC